MNISSNTQKSLHISAIHRALLKYYHGNIDGLIRPSKALKVSYQEGADPDGSAYGVTYYNRVEYLFNIKPEIVIYGKFLNYYKELEECPVWKILSTSFHEISHASHAMFVGADKFKATFIGIRESWATAVEWYLPNILYRELTNNPALLGEIDHENNKQLWPIFGNLHYSPLFIDLCDDENQYDGSTTFPNDEVFGYPLSFFNINISNLTSLDKVGEYLKNYKINGVTDAQIDNLLKIYQEEWKN